MDSTCWDPRSWRSDAFVGLLVKVAGVALAPNIKRLYLKASLRLVLSGMVPQLPCIGVLLLAFSEPPHVTFDINTGAWGAT